MPTWLVVVLAVLLVLVLLALVGVRAGRAALGGPDPTDVTIPPELAAEVSQLAVSGQQIHAIKKLRDGTGIGLAAAKQITDRMIARQQRPTAPDGLPPGTVG